MTTEPSPESGTTEPSDSEMLDWLEKNAPKELRIEGDEHRMRVDRWKSRYLTFHSWEGPTLRAAIRSAMKGEK